ncbi:Por secretion system C-terminal sorting domain-containing protein [Catalinimonas alkaloidigena]|uniref:Por secretion system C-terminal sorting domain-containing protein n=1 Tax=Catalinimonas alkaloidigena TaxID=1075417 RepID=A0A1G9D9Z6_9BACT|nr:T9SS type A sorting domain-containing protein [Catalinimonas alkaloidigena]SDK60614.1 Por secretion system C-terminal sorting domain-containing protein [Catalinimonas alkaloidigena]
MSFLNYFRQTKKRGYGLKAGTVLLLCALSFPGVSQTTSGWTRLPDAPQARTEGIGVFYQNKLYYFNGFSQGNTIIHSGTRYDLATDTWTPLPAMPLLPSGERSSVTHSGFTLVDDVVWLVGGRIGSNPGPVTDLVWKYHITEARWEAGPALPQPTGGGGLARVGNELHYIGGFDASALCDVSYHFVFDLTRPEKGWQDRTSTSPLPNPRNHFGTVVLEGKIYTIGGQKGHDKDPSGSCQSGYDIWDVHVYDPVTDRWKELAPFKRNDSHIETSSFALDGKIYTFGGQRWGYEVHSYDPATDRWSTLKEYEMPERLLDPVARVIGNKLLLTMGGAPSSDLPTSRTWVRDFERTPVRKLGFAPGQLALSLESGQSKSVTAVLHNTAEAVTYTLRTDAWPTWLKANPTKGTAQASDEAVTFTVDAQGLAAGTYTVPCTAEASGYTSATLTLTVTVKPATTNQVPVADAGPDQTVSDADRDGVEAVTLDGSASSDPDGNQTISSYSWREGGQQIASGKTGTVSLAVGVHQITLLVTDQQGAQSTDQVTIDVRAVAPAPPPTSTALWLEAECAEVGDAWRIKSSIDASNRGIVTRKGRYGHWPSDEAADRVRFNFSVNSSGTYHIFGRIRAMTSNRNSFWVRVDDGDWRLWEMPVNKEYDWYEKDGGAVRLSAGAHTIDIGYREPNTNLDKLYISTSDAAPSGLGGTAPACGTPPSTEEPELVWLEAECGDVGTQWQTGTSSEASQGVYLFSSTYGFLPSGQASRRVRFTWEVSEEGTYYLFGRVLSLSANRNSFWIRVNEGRWEKWGLPHNDEFQWVEQGRVALQAGENTLDIEYREPYTYLDKLCVSSSAATPTGLGQEGDCATDVDVRQPTLPPATAQPGVMAASLFPNPAQRTTSLILSELLPEVPVSIQVVDALGRVWFVQQLVPEGDALEYELATEALPTGLYTIQISQGEQQHLQKLVKE